MGTARNSSRPGRARARCALIVAVLALLQQISPSPDGADAHAAAVQLAAESVHCDIQALAALGRGLPQLRELLARCLPTSIHCVVSTHMQQRD
ncbi:hypothetical protein BXOR1_14975 [Xanthomonas oryzae pv. oryzicola]|nr:hypothetical protein BE73_22380 [Xanthomonas oryzae pv. oryzicola]KOR49400.1 hypothetical protein ADT27_05135 [Xanthomonas oryzae]AKK62642.1 hypothetical protein FE36_01430 [Xanthomonas oryzae pv. oryzicola]AKO02215.1 hypothetical protein ACU15_18740 [Xanthomonas oryzae pv. oryzicola]AKO03126.1 hypothetical protein ACU16_01925 [Xanthomonas oryzae pv. oryzicola]